MKTSRAQSIAFVGLTVALMSASAWIAIPFGPIMFTLQMFALIFAITVLRPKEAVAAVCAYVALGAVGVPVFSGGRGGLGVLLGPSGGYIFGYIVGVFAAAFFLHMVQKFAAARAEQERALSPAVLLGFDIAAGVLFTAISYFGGWLQFMMVMGVGAEASFAATVAPFALLDLVKIVAAALCVRAVKRALGVRLGR